MAEGTGGRVGGIAPSYIFPTWKIKGFKTTDTSMYSIKSDIRLIAKCILEVTEILIHKIVVFAM